MMTPPQAVFAAIAACMGGAAVTLLTARRRTLSGTLSFLTAAVSAGLVGLASMETLAGAAPGPARGWLAAGAACQRLQVDGLTAIFLLVAAVVALPASLYSIRYVQHHEETTARYYPYFLIFLAAMYGLLSSADTLWWFLIFWQLMVLAGYGLIRFDRSTSAQGANRYAIMLELAGAAILAGTGLLGRGAGSDTWHAVSSTLPGVLSAAPGEGTLGLILLLLGFGITMGMWPFGQMWLPHASPGAPVPVSALLCGVVIKIGAYGLMRYFLFLGPPRGPASYPFATWGMVIAVLGTITLFAGTMQALQQEQAKRLLAFHSIGQMGYVLLALGTCMALEGRPEVTAVAGLALLAALFHIVNHSLFSSLLYFNAGSVLHATGTQDLNRLGGLMKYMPLTGMTALVGSLAISGVPLFNGFASKWAIFVAAIQGAGAAGYLAICALVAILTSGLTLASFIKFFGSTFLSRTSELVKERAGVRADTQAAESRARSGGSLEVGWSMQMPQLLLAFICVLLGVFPGLAFGPLHRALAATPGIPGALLAGYTPMGTLGSLAGPRGTALFAPLALLALLGVSFLLAYGISRAGAAPRRAAAPWLCGYAPEAECQRYTAHNFYGELKRHFRWLGGVQDGKAAAVKGRAS